VTKPSFDDKREAFPSATHHGGQALGTRNLGTRNLGTRNDRIDKMARQIAVAVRRGSATATEASPFPSATHHGGQALGTRNAD
jgi:hypothetical protein